MPKFHVEIRRQSTLYDTVEAESKDKAWDKVTERMENFELDFSDAEVEMEIEGVEEDFSHLTRAELAAKYTAERIALYGPDEAKYRGGCLRVLRGDEECCAHCGEQETIVDQDAAGPICWVCFRDAQTKEMKNV